MDGERRHAQNCALWERLAEYSQPAFGRQTREANRRSGVNAEDFVDDGVEIRETLDLLVRRDRVVLGSERGVELLLKLALGGLVPGEPVRDSAGGALQMDRMSAPGSTREHLTASGRLDSARWSISQSGSRPREPTQGATGEDSY